MREQSLLNAIGSKSSIDECWCRKRSLGRPLFHESTACHLRSVFRFARFGFCGWLTSKRFKIFVARSYDQNLLFVLSKLPVPPPQSPRTSPRSNSNSSNNASKAPRTRTLEEQKRRKKKKRNESISHSVATSREKSWASYVEFFFSLKFKKSQIHRNYLDMQITELTVPRPDLALFDLIYFVLRGQSQRANKPKFGLLTFLAGL